VTYTHVVDVPAPVAVYDATHTELLRRTGGRVDGLVVHLCHATGDGFRIIEVWTDRAACERADRDLVAPIVAERAGAAPAEPGAPPRTEELTVRGLIVPAAGIAT
jgi:hypothetical protein